MASKFRRICRNEFGQKCLSARRCEVLSPLCCRALVWRFWKSWARWRRSLPSAPNIRRTSSHWVIFQIIVLYHLKQFFAIFIPQIAEYYHFFATPFLQQRKVQIMALWPCSHRKVRKKNRSSRGGGQNDDVERAMPNLLSRKIRSESQNVKNFR